jgi:hypothetical protein
MNPSVTLDPQLHAFSPKLKTTPIGRARNYDILRVRVGRGSPEPLGRLGYRIL